MIGIWRAARSARAGAQARATGRLRDAILLLLLCAAGGWAGAQSRLSVELDHPVYAVLASAELKGALPRLSSVKPYTRDEIAGFLDTMRSKPGLFSAAERAQIDELAREFSALEPSLLKMSGKKAAVGIALDVESRVDAPAAFDALGLMESGAYSGDPADLWHLQSLIQPYVRLYPEPWLSLWGTIGITYDKINRDLYLPYSFTKEWDSYHNKVSTSPTTDGAEAYPTWSFDLRSDISGATESGSFRFRLSRLRRDWGAGAGSLALSESARPFMGLEYRFRPSEYFQVSHLVGSLGSWEQGENDRSMAVDPVTGEYTAVTAQKMYAIQRLELFPFPWLTLGANGTMVGAKRLELGYFSPMMFAVEYQVTMADIDNMSLGGDLQILAPGLGKMYASVFIDEMELSGFDEWFTRPRNMFAYQAGTKFDIPLLPFGVLTAQYTKIEPFVYAHYPTWSYDMRLRVDTSYTNDGENLGYHLQPNSDELLIRLETRPTADLRTSIAYRSIRHGDNTPASGKTFLTDQQIYGDVTKYQNYNSLAAYPDKDFLHDGIYDYNNLIFVAVNWRPGFASRAAMSGNLPPFEIGATYGFSYTRWEDGENKGRSVPDPRSLHYFELNFKVFL